MKENNPEKVRILLADNEDECLYGYQKIIKDYFLDTYSSEDFIEIHTAQNYLEIKEIVLLLKKYGNLFDIALINERLGDKANQAIIELLKKNNPRIRIIASTDYQFNYNENMAKKEGYDDFFDKYCHTPAELLKIMFQD